MPNWCANLLEIAGPEEEKKRFLENALEKDSPTHEAGHILNPLSLSSLYPRPEDESDWYHWNIEHWGTKWDIDAELLNPDWEDNNDNLVFKFDSAWGPPDSAFHKIAEDYPLLGFSLLFAEPGMGFEGSVNWNTSGDYYFGETHGGNIWNIVAEYIWGYKYGYRSL